MIFKKTISAVKVPHHKNTAAMPSQEIAPPKEVLLPTNMHSGQAAEVTVQVGDHVFLGQEIAHESGKISAPLHASVSGTVTAIERKGEAPRDFAVIHIESDGKMEKDPEMKAPVPTDLDSFLAGCLRSGIVGLGGAAFPLWGKLDAARKNHIGTVLINGAECEPYITSDHHTMIDHADLIVKGVELIKQFLGSERFVIGIENNKPDAIAKMQEVFAGDSAVEVKPLKSIYPQGAKQVLLFNATGLVVGEGQRLASLGVIIINVTTLAKMAEYFTTGMPLVSKCITVDGSAVNEPKSLVVPVGTPIRDVIAACGGLKEEGGKVIYGGPMMGKCARSVDEPILKATNAIVVLTPKDSERLEPTPCIHCGRCVAHCPLSLNPTAFAKAMELDSDDEREAVLSREKVQLCMECGCCTYVCPAHRPLAETNHQAKGFMRQRKAAAKAKEEKK